jgi:hypothetical protein
VKELEALAEKYPKAAAAKLAKLLSEVIAVGWVPLEFDDRDAAAGLLPVFKLRFVTKILNTKCRRGAGSTLKDQQHPMLSQQE